VRGWQEAVGALVFPWSCPLCGVQTGEEPICAPCRQELLLHSSAFYQSACPRCALPTGPFTDLEGGCASCRGRSLGFDAAFALGPYEGAIRTLCLQLKHEQNAWLAPRLADLLFDARCDAFARLPADAWIVPIPLHWWRYWQRGYNQAEALARGLARRLGLAVHGLLRRVVPTHQLTSMSAAQRRHIMRRVFRVRSNPHLAGRTVILVDDVLTTGATCGAAARSLRNAGAARVVAVVIGRTTRTVL
jgi:ComF family protein